MKRRYLQNFAEKIKFDLAWKIHEFEDLQELLTKLTVEISTLTDKLEVLFMTEFKIILQGGSIQFKSKCWMQLRGCLSTSV